MRPNEIEIFNRNGWKIIEIAMNIAKYHGIVWTELSELQKRKYENFQYLANQERSRIKFLYV